MKEFQGKAKPSIKINIFSKASCDIKREKIHTLSLSAQNFKLSRLKQLN
jgi:hypothetical protein